MLKSNTNSVKVGPYIFQPTKYDENNNLYCKIVKRHKYKKFVKDTCKLTGIYNFAEGKFTIIFCSKDFLNHQHSKLLNMFLKEYDWV